MGDDGIHKLVNSPRPGLEVVERKRVAKEQAVQSVPTRTVQNEKRDVLGRMTTGAAQRT